MLNFDEATTRLLDDAYQGGDATARRKINFDNLQTRPGDHVLDHGCGNGLMTVDLARAVGPTGRVVGLDTSADMLAAARSRCAGRDTVDLVQGDAFDMPFDDDTFDRVVSVQVFEYFDDLPMALTEAQRVTRPGGRIVIGDIHWDMMVWHSAEPDRMAHVLGLWDRHLANRVVPAQLSGLIRGAGLALDSVLPLTITDTVLRPDGIAQMMLHLIRGYLIGNALMPEADVLAWVAEQHQLASDGGFFYAYTHFSTAATVPD